MLWEKVGRCGPLSLRFLKKRRQALASLSSVCNRPDGRHAPPLRSFSSCPTSSLRWSNNWLLSLVTIQGVGAQVNPAGARAPVIWKTKQSKRRFCPSYPAKAASTLFFSIAIARFFSSFSAFSSFSFALKGLDRQGSISERMGMQALIASASCLSS